MIFATFTRTAVMRGIGSHRLSGCRTCQQTGEHTQRIQIRHDLLHAESGYIQFGIRSTHIGIPFIGADYNVSGRGYGKVGARHGGFRIQKEMTQVLACGMSKVGRVEVSFFRPHFLFKQFSHLFPFDVDSRKNDMARFEMHQLQNTFTQVGLYHVYSAFHQEGIQPALFGKHRLALDEMMYIMLIQYFVHNGTIFVRIFCPVHNRSISSSVLFKLLQKLFEMAVGIQFQFTSLVAKLFPFGNFLAHLVPFGSDHPKGFVMPCCHLTVLQELFGSL